MCEKLEKSAYPKTYSKDLVPNSNAEECNIILIEPFYGGSHKQLIDTLVNDARTILTKLSQTGFSKNNGTLELEVKLLSYSIMQGVEIKLVWIPGHSGIAGFLTSTEILPYVVTLPAKKWHWRARTSALYLSQIIPVRHNFKTLFTSSVLNLAELIALRPDLSGLRKVVYFHENQLVYPVRKAKDRDFQYGYNQILTCLVADAVLFNSKYNKDSFLNSINKFFKVQPDYRPKDLEAKIVGKCEVLYFPLSLPILEEDPETCSEGILHIVWPHRWEHDKNPDAFFRILFSLKEDGFNFKVSVLGESFSEVPDVFSVAQSLLDDRIVCWGHLENKDKYYLTLKQSDVAVSTAKHEFYGIAMLEATYCGCFPLCPNDLVYPELYPIECLYNNEGQLEEMLMKFCKNPQLARQMRKKLHVDFRKYSTENLFHKYTNILFS